MTQRYRRWRSSGRGFTLLEVLVAMVLFAVSFLGFAQLQVGNIQANAKAAQRTFATTVAQETIERIRNGGGCADATFTQGAITYSLACTATAGPNNTQNITVIVSWSAPLAQSVVLQTRL